MDAVPTHLQQQERTLVVPEKEEIARILGCDLVKAGGIWESLKKSQAEIEVKKGLEMAGLLKSNSTPSSILRVFQLAQSYQKNSICMALDN